MNLLGDELLRMYLRLHLAENIGSIGFRRLLDAFGGIEKFWSAGPAQWRQVSGVGEAKAAAIAAVTHQQVDEELSEAASRDVKIFCPLDEGYPAALKAIHDPPPVLYVRGELEAADAMAMAVVGARRCTHYGLEQAERFGQLLARAAFTVVSGGARGIDTAAHRGALAASGRTIAVMGCGLSTTYPQENADLFERIIAERRGAVVSELPMRTAVLAGNFPTRNRIISGLSLGVLVVEAARRSGSLITARIADEQGRNVFAVPGRVDSPMSWGVNELIRDGAVLVQNLDDILGDMGRVGEQMACEEPADDIAAVPAGLDETQSKLITTLGRDERSLDELVRATDIPSGRAASAMTMLVLRGLIEQRPGNVFARKRRQ
ncbi:MAG: DNA-processing protein DprA [Planctomycetes bacterium]|nr:DNA-processing protein DprA [Planctomycetota bacterium]